jgi:hypothetical protein
MSWCSPVNLCNFPYILFGSCFANCFTERIPNISKSRNIAGPTEIRSCNLLCACINAPSNIRFTFATRNCKLYPDPRPDSTPLSLGSRP